MSGKFPGRAAITKLSGRMWVCHICLLAGFVGLPAASANAPVPADIRRDATVDAVEQVMPSVVNIATSRRVQLDEATRRYMEAMRRFYPRLSFPQAPEKINSIGSGVIIDEGGEDGYILTNNHVIEDASRIQVQLWDGREYEAQRLLWTPQKDLALLKIVRKPGELPFKPIRLAKDDDLLLGETVIAMGNPFGLGGSVSRGILSSKNRRTGPGNQTLDFSDWLQTDADINPGNSGGPLINLRGELIGINVAVYGVQSEEKGMGIGFAIPVKQISAALSDFFTLEWTASLWFGARLKAAPYPLIVREVQAGSPADQAGLRVGQEIEAVNGQPVRGLVEFNALVAANADRLASLTVLENGTRRTLRVELLPMRELLPRLLQRRLGLAVQPLTPAQAAQFKIKPGEALLVGEVEGRSPAERARLQRGILLATIDGNPVNDLVNAASALDTKPAGERVQLTFLVPRLVNGNLVQLQPAGAAVVLR